MAACVCSVAFRRLALPVRALGAGLNEIDLKAGNMKVRSPKTEHHDGKDHRIMPIFPELRPYLEAAIAELPKGAEYVITLPGVVRCRACDKASNLGTEMKRIIKRAGLTPWPKL